MLGEKSVLDDGTNNHIIVKYSINICVKKLNTLLPYQIFSHIQHMILIYVKHIQQMILINVS